LPEIERLLDGNEKILWTNKPVKKAFIMPALGSVPFGLFFLGFSIFFLFGVSSAGAPGFFALFVLLFVLIAVGLTFGPSLWQLLRYRNTEYVITDRRIITQTGAVGLDTRFVDFQKIQEVYVKIGIFDRLFGTGSVYVMTAGAPNFSPAMGPYGYGFGGAYGFRPSLAALKDPYDVQKLLQEAIERSRGAKSFKETML
jgi:membrane protein YdbS with pleckstrin-like domain